MCRVRPLRCCNHLHRSAFMHRSAQGSAHALGHPSGKKSTKRIAQPAPLSKRIHGTIPRHTCKHVLHAWFFALGATNQRRFKRVAFYRHRPCRVLRPFDSDRCAREPFKPSERRSRMRRGSLPRGSAHRLYRSRLPNDFSNLRHHRFRSGSMGNGGERRTPKPKNACGSRVCTPVRCVRSSPGRVNRSKHARSS